MTSVEILKRLYKDYTKKFLKKIALAFIFSLTLAGSTSAVAYLLDPAINELFVKQTKSLTYIIPIVIVLAFAAKGLSLYFAKLIMIGILKKSKGITI